MIETCLWWTIIIILGVILLFLAKDLIYKNLSNTSLKIRAEKDLKLVETFLEKFPLVSPEFIKKTLKEQNIENNQEIHELNKKITELDGRIHAQNANINKVVAMLDEIKNKVGNCE